MQEWKKKSGMNKSNKNHKNEREETSCIKKQKTAGSNTLIL